MITLPEVLFLGIVQGLTEWLPISSSGHLVIAQQLLGIRVPLLFDIMLHVGTLFAVFAFFWKDILEIVSSVLKLDFKSDKGRIALFIIVATVPIVLAGPLFYGMILNLFGNLFAVGIALMVTGAILYSTRYSQAKQGTELDLRNAFLIGLSQALSLVPGISRSGITISLALSKGIDKRQAFTFSFLLAIPAVIGAAVFELYRTTGFDTAINLEMFAGTAAAAIVGYFSLKFLRGLLEKKKLYLFAYYCWVVGAAVSIYAYLGL